MIKVNGYEDRYSITEDGKVYSHKVNRFMSPNEHKNGYLSVSLYNGVYSRRHSVHRLVAIHFVPNPLNKSEVNHMDGDKSNNNKENLEWATRAENNLHALQMGLRIAPNKYSYNKNYYNSKPLIYVKDVNVYEFISIKECARYFNVTKSAIQRAIGRATGFFGGMLTEG